ncbi:MAG: RNA repair transcriptional activator RtcR family protein, partial [Hyphomicrobium sp.]
MKPRVVIGFLGSTLDQGKNAERWQRWRPTVALCQHEDLVINRLDLIHSAQHASLASRVAQDIAQVSPETEVRLHTLEFKDAWDFEEVYSALHDFARLYPFDTDAEEYLVHITTGTHVGQICWFLLTEARVIPGRLLQLTPPKRWKDSAPGTYGVIDLDLSRYDEIATRFKAEQAEAASFLKSGIETRNAGFNAMIERIEQVAVRSKAPVLLTGPTGAGKSQLARKIYELKHARHQIKGPFVEVNCATLRGDSAMSALFGHVKGAFTGAMSDRAGLLRAA